MKPVAVKGFAYDVVLFQCPGIQATDKDKWRDKETWRKLYQVGRSNTVTKLKRSSQSLNFGSLVHITQ